MKKIKKVMLGLGLLIGIGGFLLSGKVIQNTVATIDPPRNADIIKANTVATIDPPRQQCIIRLDTIDPPRSIG